MYGAIVFLGNGDGTLQEPLVFDTDYRNGPTPSPAADFNADGKIDLVTTNYFSNAVSVLLGNGDGSFARAAVLRRGQRHADRPTRQRRQRRRQARSRRHQSVKPPGPLSVLLGKGDGQLSRADHDLHRRLS